MSEAIAAQAARARLVEREKGLLRSKKLRERALEKFGTEVGAIWLATRPSRKGLSPLDLAMGSDAGLKASLEALEYRFVDKNCVSDFQEKFRTWAEKKFRGKGLRFIQKKNDGLPDRRTPLQCCFDDVSSRTMQELTTLAMEFA